jgi:hypothetical protein
MMMVPALGLGLACTAILNPRDDVERCGSATDCEASGDERYDVVCVYPEGEMLDSTEVDKICVAQDRVVSCDPMSYPNTDHPLQVALDTFATFDRYNCPDDQKGLLGCAPRTTDNMCADGLVNMGGACDDTDPDTVPLAGNPDFAGQDVLDQFCRSFFCDDEYVCDRETGFTCVRCDPDLPFGNGGCGTVVVAGAPSCVYSDECDAPDSSVDEPNFGACN